jgi:hypothetical protein
MRIVAIFVFMALVLAPAALAEQHCSQTDLQAAAQRAKATQAQLLGVLVEGQGMDCGVAPSIQKQISALKEALAATADATMRCTANAADGRTIESGLVSLLDANKPVVQRYDSWDKIPATVDQIYGADLDVRVSRPANHPQIVLVEASFGISCSMDSMLLGYEWRSNGWQRVLRWQSGNYDQISGAFGDFFAYQVVPQNDSGDWLIAVAHGFPWCTSNMSAFDLDLIQPMKDHIPQQVVFHKKAGYAREPGTVMKSEPGGFELRMNEFNSDINTIIRPVIYRYRVTGKDVIRIQPIANNGRDFVDVWLESPWADAERWSAPSELARLEATHKKIEVLNDPTKIQAWDFTYGPIRTCSDSSSHFQVELDQRWPDQPKTPNKPTFFQIQEGKNSFTMLSASEKPDPHCTGHDIMPKQ